MIKWILFDGYGTLLNAGKENIPWLATQMGNKYSMPADLIFKHWSTSYFKLERQFDKKFMTIMQANRISLSYAFGVLGLPVEDIEDWMQQLIHFWSYPDLYDGVLELFDELRTNNPAVHLGVISNTDEDTILSAVNNSHLPISFVMSSERAQYYKPDPRIFIQSLQELQIEASECVYIGNSVSDMVGAERASIPGIYLNRDRKALPEELSHIPIVADIQALQLYLRNKKYCLL